MDYKNALSLKKMEFIQQGREAEAENVGAASRPLCFLQLNRLTCPRDSTVKSRSKDLKRTSHPSRLAASVGGATVTPEREKHGENGVSVPPKR